MVRQHRKDKGMAKRKKEKKDRKQIYLLKSLIRYKGDKGVFDI